MRFTGGFLALVLFIGLLGGCGGDTEPNDAANDSRLAVSLASVERQTLAREIVASGIVAAWEDMPLGVETSGLRVTQVCVEVGQTVKAGEVLLTLDDRGPRSDLSQMRAAVAEAEAALQLATADLKRSQQLHERALLSAAEFDQLRAVRTQAKARLGSARAALDAAELRLSYTRLKAPDDGVISLRAVQPGEVVSSGATLLGLIRKNRLEWRAQVSGVELPQMAIGQSVRLRAPDGSPLEGRVRAIAPGLDAVTRTAVVHADLPDPEKLHAGMVTEGRIAVGQADALTVPLASIVRRDGHAYAFSVDSEGRVNRHRIDAGLVVHDRIEVISGLDEGQQVVERGAGFLSEGDRVRVVPAARISP